ncbi:MAG: substrate-binding domain-containing protein [Planctomycetaceae bacterium]|nr:substrate-binding domain-containing protein [Planctomycetaceae bacterium]
MKRFIISLASCLVASAFFVANFSPLFGQQGVFYPNPSRAYPSAAYNGDSIVSGDVALPDDNQNPNYSPDDPQLGELQKRKQELHRLYSLKQQEFVIEQQKITAHQTAINEYLLDSHLRELQSLKPRQQPNGKTAGLDVLNFPEMDGSTSCLNLGTIVASYVLGVPYQWVVAMQNQNHYNNRLPFFRTYPPLPNTGFHDNSYNNSPGTELRVVADAEKATFRQRNIFWQYFGQFQGTHEAYLSLIGKLTKADPNNPNHPFNSNSNNYPQIPGADGYNVQPDEKGKYPTIDPTVTPDNRGRFAFPQSEILLIARRPSKDEKKAMELADVELDIRPIALDGFIFVVNRKNPVESLTLEQIQSIYASQQQKSWSDFGGSQNQVIPYERNRNSGSRELMDELVVTPEALQKYRPQPAAKPSATKQPRMSPIPAAQIPSHQHPQVFAQPINVEETTPPSVDFPAAQNVDVFQPSNTIPLAVPAEQLMSRGDENFRNNRRIFGESGGGMSFIFSDLQRDPNAIGYSVYHYEHFMLRVLETRVLAVDGVFPNYETIRDKTYPLVYEIYVVTRKGIADDLPAAKLRDWLLSDDGQRAVRECGYVPINPVVAAE